MDVIQRLVEKGNSILVIVHNLDVIPCADWIFDLGPDGGDKGGEIVVVGTPLKRWQSIPPAIRADTSSKCCSSIRQREWRCEGGLGGVGEGLGVAWVVATRIDL